MPSLQSVTLADRETVPVNHTFAPRGKPNGVAELVETAAVPIGENVLRVSMKEAPNGKFKGRLTLYMPIVQTETINGVSLPKVVRKAVGTVDVVFEASSTLQERKNLIGLLADALAASKVIVNDAFTKLETVW